MKGTMVLGNAVGSETVGLAWQAAQAVLKDFVTEKDYREKLRVAFGDRLDEVKVEGLTAAWAAGDFGDFPAIEVRDAAEINGARGAFAQATGKIYLAEELVSAGDVGAIASVLLEEYGHYLDARLNDEDAIGDEGEIFAGLVQGVVWSESELAGLKGEDDSAVVLLDQQEVAIEQQSKSDTLNFLAEEIDFNPFDGEIKFFDVPFELPPATIDSFGVKFKRELQGNLTGTAYAKADLGILKISYPITVDVQGLPENAQPNEKITLTLNSQNFLNSPSSGSFEGSQGLEFDGGIKFGLEGSKFSFKDIEVKNPFNSKKPFTLDGVDIGGSTLKAEVNYNLSTLLKESGKLSISDVGSIGVELPKIESFKKSIPKDGSTSFPSIAASGTSNNIINLEIDVDKALSLIYPPLKALGNSISFPNDLKEKATRDKAKNDLKDELESLRLSPTPETLKEVERLTKEVETANNNAEIAEKNAADARVKGELSYDLLDLKASGGLALQQDLEFDPTTVKVTMTAIDENGNPTQTQEGKLEDDKEYTFQIPPEGCGVLKVKAKYELSGEVENNFGLVTQGSIKAEAVKLEAKLKFPANTGSASFGFGPALSLEQKFSSSSIFEPLPLWGTDEIEPSENPFYKKIEPKKVEPNSTGAKGLTVEVEYEIPYNLPVSVSDVTVLEGNSGTKDMVFPVTLRDTPKEDVTLSYESVKGSGTVTIPAGKTSGEVKFSVSGDEIKEDDETFTLTIKDQAGKLFADCKGTDSSKATGTIVDDDKPPEPPQPEKRVSGVGDPHLVTLDGLRYDFQSAGEFIFLKSTSGDLEVQVRQSQYGNSGLVSVNSAIATKINGKRVGFYLDDTQPLLIDGQPVNVDGNTYLDLGGGGRIYREGNTYTAVINTSGEQLVVQNWGSHLDVNVFLAETRESKVSGLGGNNNSLTDDDIALRDGTILSQPLNQKELYGKYEDSWRVSQSESLFDYKPGQTTETFTDPYFPSQYVTINDLDPTDRLKAQNIALAAGITDPKTLESAIIDLVLSDFNESFLESALNAKQASTSLVVIVPPKASDDSVITTVNTPANIEVLVNDTGTVDFSLVIQNFESTTLAGGTIQLNNNNTPDDKTDDQLTYTPPANFTGADSFNYTLSDGTQTDTAKVTITVPEFNLSSLNGNNGFILKDTEAGNFSGASVSNIGDFNGDQIDDLIVGALAADPNGNNSAGKSFIVFGTTTGFPTTFDVSTLNGRNGFVLNGIDTESFSGSAVSHAGDINNDGFDDIIIGAFGATVDGKNNAGKTYVLFGNNNQSPNLDLSALNGNNGFSLNGTNEFDYLGLAVSGAGDVNNDGIDDMLIGAPGGASGGFGKAYVLFGRNQGFAPSLSLADISGDNGFTINNTAANVGISVSAAGDINADGIADLVIGTEANSNRPDSAGESYIVFGSAKAFSDNINLSDLNGKNGVLLNGIDKNASTSVSSAGDVNADGIDDLIVAETSESNLGKSYIVFGRKKEFPASLDLSKLNGTDGFLVFNGVDGNSITSADTTGDLNGDGIDDIAFGVSASAVDDKFAAGKTYVMFGNNGGFLPAVNLSTLDGSNGFILNGAESEDLSGISVSEAGDMNHDGIDDLIIGSPGSLFNNSPGKSQVVFGNTNFGKNSNNLAKLIFDPGFYLKTNPDVVTAIESGEVRSAFEHFSKVGLKEGRLPSPIFAEYLNQNPDVAAAVSQGKVRSGFEHFIKAGFAEGRLSNPEFSLLETFYLAENSDVEKLVQQGRFASGLEHLVRVGLTEGRNPFPRLTAISETFNAEEYLTQNPDVADAVNQGLLRDGFQHFIKFGLEEGRNPSNAFSESLYLSNYPDVAEAVNQGLFRSGIDHFIKAGFSEDRSGEDLTDIDLLTGSTEAEFFDSELTDDIADDEFANDPLTGNPSSNVFVLQPGEDSQVIAEFEDGIDFLGLNNGTTFEQLVITPGDGTTLINLNDQPLASLIGVEASSISRADFIAV